jgi:branched-subunit amino acid transport protein
MSASAIWLTVVIAGLGTFAIRLSFLALIRETTRIPDVAMKALRLIPSAVLAALVLPAILRPGGPWDLSIDNFRLIAGAAAWIVAWRTRNVLATITVGMAVLWTLEAVA